MLSSIKATLLHLSEMSWPARINFKQWIKQSVSFANFDMREFDSFSLRIAEAKNAQGESLCFVPVQKAFLINAFALRPGTSEDEARTIGDVIDAEVARVAQQEGISEMLIVLPADHPGMPLDEFETLRVYRRKVPSKITSGGIALHNPISATKYLN